MKRKITEGEDPTIVNVRSYARTMCIGNWEIPSDAKWAGPIEEPISSLNVEEYYKE